MIRLTFEVDGVRQLDRALSRFGEGIHDMSPAFHQIAESFKRIERRQFDTEGGSGGQAWAPLSANYAEWKARLFGDLPILQITGRLMSSLTGDNAHYVERVSPEGLVVGTSDPRALFHQRGTTRMPARQVIHLSDADKTEWMKILHNFAFDRAKEAGLR